MNQPNMADLFGKMMEMQQKMAETQEALAKQTTTAEAGGGMIKVTADGRGRVTAISMEKEVVNPDDLDLLEDLLVAGINKALDEADQMREAEMKKVAGGMLPPGLDLGGMGFGQ
ncbi:MAG: YbaB/EbfC family nucleoid-associated protein [Rhodothermales bacterium]|nr:YbaB/EbfC family nucleoid-associated protein [Rhodothermales bacterium]